ncbi:MAG TPA: hypothetical protein VFL53_00690 [Pseudolabrys sp.]|nr:hypothetical protein [Pseudolabrys sp.]
MLTIASLALLVVLTPGDWTTTETARNVTLVYVGADKCAPCDNWQRNQGTAFRKSADFNRVSYREVKSPNLFDVLKDNYWPEDLRIYREAIDQRAGVPLWLVVADDQLVLQRSGLSQWQSAVLPKIRSLTGPKIIDRILAALPVEQKIGSNR